MVGNGVWLHNIGRVVKQKLHNNLTPSLLWVRIAFTGIMCYILRYSPASLDGGHDSFKAASPFRLAGTHMAENLLKENFSAGCVKIKDA
jgi:hypothetical protein